MQDGILRNHICVPKPGDEVSWVSVEFQSKTQKDYFRRSGNLSGEKAVLCGRWIPGASDYGRLYVFTDDPQNESACGNDRKEDSDVRPEIRPDTVETVKNDASDAFTANDVQRGVPIEKIADIYKDIR